MKNRVSYSFLVIFFLLVDFVAFAQPGDDDGSGGLEGNDPPPAPINGQLIWLGVIAIVFAYYSIRRYRKLA
ncbi:MAG: hypothetical protein IPN80_08790 [Flavobacterium sp.]|nr:hypothetical protein [Flavobacterium sp.]